MSPFQSMQQHIRRAPLAIAAATLIVMAAVPLAAQDDDRDPVTHRRVVDDEPVVLNFNRVKVSETIDFIVETSGKTVIPSPTVLSMTVTVVNDVPLPRDEALNRLFTAFLDHQIGVVESRNLIKLGQINDIAQSDCPVVGAEESLLDRDDEGVIINKVFQLSFAEADSVQEALEELFPDWVTVNIEPGSNSIVALCSVGIGKKLERTIEELDRERTGEVRVFKLKFADAEDIAEKIMAFFGPDESSGGGAANRNPRDPRQFRPPTPGGGGTGVGDVPIGGVVGLRAIADAPNNVVSVRGEASLLDQIANMIENYWDRPFPKPNDLIRTYHLEYRDVLKVRDILSQLGGGAAASTGAQPGTRIAAAQQGGAGAGTSGGQDRLSNVFQFQADEGANELIVIAKTPSSFDFLDQLIAQLDVPNPGERATYIELKHADAGNVAEEINVLFAKPGLRVQTQARQEGLQDFDPGAAFDDDAAAQSQQQQQQGQSANFPWQLDRPDPSIAPESTLIGKVRVMPVYRQNAVLIIGAPHYKQEVVDLIARLDRPGRQVLITAVIAEVQSSDGLTLGLRWGRTLDTFGSPQDNQFAGSGDLTGTEENILSQLFDTSVLNVNVNIAALIDFLKQEQGLRVVSQPRIFTHDNEQANFFDGQEIQVATDSQITGDGIVNQSFEFRDVGVQFSVRPRITPEREVDLLVNLALSALNPASTPNGGIIFDRRQTTTRVIVQDRQTIVVSGILRESESDVTRKFPLLGDIPLIGALFTSVDQEEAVTEVVAFITPIVVDNPSENDSLNVPFRNRLDEIRRPLDEQLDDPGDRNTIWGDDVGFEIGGETAPSWIEDVGSGAHNMDGVEIEYNADDDSEG